MLSNKNMRNSILFVLLAVAVPAFPQAPHADSMPNPAGPLSLQANWSTTQDGSPLLSWIEKAKDGSYTLKYAIHKGAAWQETHTVAAQRHFFRHPAELPEVMTLPDGTLIAHWVEMPKEPSDAEYAYVSTSHDGTHWTAPIMAHKDRSPVQHGLASMVASGDHEASLLWLEALKGDDGPTALKRTVINADGTIAKEESLDSDVCGCCPTSVVKTLARIAGGLPRPHHRRYPRYRDHSLREWPLVAFENSEPG